MTQTPAAERMSELRELLEKATPGEWLVGGPYPGTSVCIAISGGISYPPEQAEPPEWDALAILDQRTTGEPNAQAQADAALICAMKNALPDLLDTIERLQADNQSLLDECVIARRAYGEVMGRAQAAERELSALREQKAMWERMIQAERALDEIRGQKAVAWMIEYTDRGTRMRRPFGHNAIGDYRDFDPKATSTPLIPLPAQCAKGEG